MLTSMDRGGKTENVNFNELFPLKYTNLLTE